MNKTTKQGTEAEPEVDFTFCDPDEAETFAASMNKTRWEIPQSATTFSVKQARVLPGAMPYTWNVELAGWMNTYGNVYWSKMNGLELAELERTGKARRS